MERIKTLPDSEIWCFRDVNIDVNYDNTYYFTDETSQINYFQNLDTLIYHSPSLHYIRQNTYVDVNAPIDDLFQCNYIIYNNWSFERTYIYNFVTNVEYVNNNVTRLYIQMDVIQTYLTKWTLGDCFVKRQHVTNDVRGQNVEPEPVNIGKYVYTPITTLYQKTTGKIGTIPNSFVVAATFNDDFVDAQSGLSGGFLSGLYFNVFDNWLGATSFIHNAVTHGKSNGIVNVFMVPKYMADKYNNTSPYTDNISFPKSHTLGTYTPQNNKLLTYPYSMLDVVSAEGTHVTYRWEDFLNNDGYCWFAVRGALTSNPSIGVFPLQYQTFNRDTPRYTQGVMITNFAQCGYNTDTYAAYVAMNTSTLDVTEKQLATNVGYASVNSIIGSIGDVIKLDFGGVVNNVKSVTDTYGNIEKYNANLIDMDRQASVSYGVSQGNAVQAAGDLDIYFHDIYITHRRAEKIDSFFNQYGYAINAVQTPNLCARQRFTFIQCENLEIKCSAQANIIQQIVTIFAKGITFWNDKNSFGDTQSPNPIVMG